MDWIYLNNDDFDNTFPKEGYEVLVSDGTNYDVAWYIWSSTYKWVKTDVINDDLNDFKNFAPIKWKYIDE